MSGHTRMLVWRTEDFTAVQCSCGMAWFRGTPSLALQDHALHADAPAPKPTVTVSAADLRAVLASLDRHAAIVGHVLNDPVVDNLRAALADTEGEAGR